MVDRTDLISVIVPTLNEAAKLRPLLCALMAESTPHEIIVVDGGSTDGTIEHARSAGVEVLPTTPGRGRQLVRGAAAAKGDVLWFLHADTVPPSGALAAIRSALDSDPDLVGGNFRVVFDGGDRFSRWLTGFYAWFRGHGLYYGDSGVFARRTAYHAIGGIRPIALFEDYDFTRKLERAGPTTCIADRPLLTSSRRFAGRSPIAIVAGWLWLHALFYLRMSPARLAVMYDSERQRRPDDRPSQETRP
jgi:rSAM/selenodomain-associated transferase 2